MELKMVTAVFDTLAYSKKLQAAGVTLDIAEVHAVALSEIIQDRLATKEDLNELRRELSHEIESLRIETKHDIMELRHRIDDVISQLTIRLGSMMAAGIILLATFHKIVG